jgi:hypothetical protein
MRVTLNLLYLQPATAPILPRQSSNLGRVVQEAHSLVRRESYRQAKLPSVASYEPYGERDSRCR